MENKDQSVSVSSVGDANSAPSSDYPIAGIKNAGDLSLEPIATDSLDQPGAHAAASIPEKKATILRLLRRADVALMLLLAVVLVVIVASNLTKKPVDSQKSSATSKYGAVEIPLEGFVANQNGVDFGSSRVVINGPLTLNDSFVIAPSVQPNNPVAGQLYFDNTTNQMAYYNGAAFVPLSVQTTLVQSLGGAAGAITLGGGLSVVNNQLTVAASGVTSFGGQQGGISLGNGLRMDGNTLQNAGVTNVVGGTGITVANDGNGTVTITNSGSGGNVNTAGGTSGRLSMFNGAQSIGDSIVSQAAGTITITGDLNVSGAFTLAGLDCTGNANGGVLTTNGSGQIVCDDDDGGAGSSISGAGSNGTVPLFNGANSITNSIITQAGTTVTIAGDLSLNTDLSVANGGTGVSSFIANGVVYGNGTNPLQVTAAGTSGQVLIADGSGIPTFVSFSGDVNVAANGTTTIQANSVALGTDTVGDYIANLGVATGLTVGSNTGEGSAPTLSVNYGAIANTAVQGNVTLTCPSGTGNLTGGGTSITLGTGGSCGNISTVNNPTFSTSVTSSAFILTGTGSSGTIQVANLGQGTVYTLPDPGGAAATICISTGNCATAGVAGGDLTGSYPNPTIAKLQGTNLDIASPTAGHILVYNQTAGEWNNVAVTGDIAISETGVGTIQANSVALGTDTTGNYVLNLTAGNGIDVTGTAGEGWTPTVSVLYGSSANTAVQGNVGLTVTAGTNLTGGGSITLGAGGSVTLNVASSPVFTGTLAVQGATVTVGGAAQQGSVVLNDGSANTGAIQTAALGQNTTYTLPDPGGASANICLSTGNCAGAGGGVTGAGTNDRVTKFTSTGSTVGDSSISDDGSTVTLNGSANLVVQGGTSTLGTLSQAGTLAISDGSSNTVSIVVSALANNRTYTLPDAGGPASFCLSSGNCIGGVNGSAPNNAAYLLASLDGTLTNERALAAGSNVALTDAGANGNFTVATVQNPTFTTSVTTPILQSSGALTISSGATTVAIDATTTIELQDSTNVTGTLDVSVALNVGTANAFAVSSGGAITAATGITSSGTITFSGLDCTAFTNGGALTTNGSGQLVCSNDDGGAGGAITGAGTSGTVALFTGTNTIADSIVTQAGTTINIAGDLTLTTDLTVANGGTGASSFTTNGILYGNGSGALQVTAVGTSGQVLVANGSGIPTFVSFSGDVNVAANGATTIQANSVALGTDTTGDYVQNLGTLTGLTTGGNSGEGSTPSLSVTYGAIANTAVQGNVTLTCPSGSGNLTGGGTSITLGTGGSCGNLSTVNNPTFTTSVTSPSFILTGAGSNGTIQIANLGQGTVYTLPDPGGAAATICISTGNCATAGSAGGDLTGTYPNPTIAKLQNTNLDISSPTAGHILVYNQTNSEWNNVAVTGDIAISETGASTIQANAVALGTDTTGNYILNLTAGNGVSVTGTAGEGWTPTVTVLYGSSANTAVEGNTSLTVTAGTNLTGGGAITLGAGGAVTLNVASSPTFSGTLTVQGASATIGGAAQQGTVVLNDGNGQTASILVGSALAANTNLAIPTAVGANDTICLQTLGNCAGSGGGVTGAGTNNRVSKFTTTGSTIGDSTISDDGTTVTINGTANFVVQGGTGTFGTLTQAGTIAISDGSNHTVSIVAASLGNNRTYTLPEVGGPAVFCMDTGNCLGGGGGSAPNNAAYLLASLDGTLTNDRALTAGSNVSFTDAGANGNFTVATVMNPSFTTSVTTPVLQSSGALTISSGATTVAIDATTTIELQDSTNVTGTLDVSVALNVGTANAFAVSSGGTITAATGITSSGTITFSALNCTGNANGGALTANGSGQLVCTDDDGGAGNAIAGTGTNGTLPVFTAAQTIADSIVTQTGGNTINIAGSLTLTTDLTVANGGTGASSFTSNGVLFGNGSGALSVTAAGTSGQVLVANGSGVPTFVSFAGDVAVAANGTTTIQANSVALGTDTTGDYVQNLGTLTGLTTGGNSGEGSTPSLSVTYGSSANTSVQGNITLTCPSGTGNLTGGGTSITLGTGGSCGNLTIVNNPTFSTSVTSPSFILTGAGSNGTLGVASLGQATAYTLPDPGSAAATICISTGNCATAGTAGGDLTGTYPNPTIAKLQNTNLDISSPTAGHILVYNQTNAEWNNVAVTGDIAISETGVSTIQVNSVALGTDTTGNYVLGLTAGNGINITGSAGEGWSPTVTVAYGSAANTAVEGNTSLTVTAGTNLTGGGAITLGAGGSVTLNVASSPTFSGTLTVQGATATIGGAAQQGTVVLNDGNGQTASISVGSALAANTSLAIPTAVGVSDTFCLQTLGNCSGAAATLQSVYNNSSNPELVVDATRGALTVRDNSTPLGANLLEVQNNAGSTTYLAVTASGVAVTGTATVSGSINTTGGALQTNSVTRVDNSGNLVNIGNLTAAAAITIASTGAGNDIYIDGADEFIVQDAAVFDGTAAFNSDVDLTLSGTENLAVTSTVSGTTAINVINGVITNNTSSGNQNVMLLQNLAGSGTTEGLLVLDNTDTDTAVSGGLTIISSAGGITNAIDVSDSDIGAALLFGANDIVGTNFNITGSNGSFTSAGNAIIQGGSTTLGTTSQQGSLVLHDGNGQTATISMGSALAANTALALPTGVGASDTFCLQTLANCAGTASTLQSAYNASTNPEIVVDATRGALTVRDNSTPLGANLLEVQNNAGSTTYFAVTASGVSVTGTSTTSGNINTTGGVLQTNSVTRIDNSGNATNIGSLTLSGAVSGGTSYSGSGNINSTAGALQTANTTRVDNSGNLVSIGNLTATAAITIASTGAGNDIIFNSADTIELQDNTNIGGNVVISGNAADALTVKSSANGTGVVVLNIQQNDNDSVLRVTDTGLLAIGNAANVAGALAIGNGATGYYAELRSTNLTAARLFEFPDAGGTICTDSGNCGGTTGTLQTAYNFSTGGTTPEIKLDATRTGIDVQDANSTLGSGQNFLSLRGSNGSGLGTILVGFGMQGNLYMRPSTDRTDLIDINNNAGNNVFTVDSATGTGRVGIGLGSSNLPGFTLDVGGTINATGAVTAGTYNGQTISSAASFTGTVAVAGNTTLTGDIAVNGGDITSSGALNITPGGALVAGATGQAATLQGTVTTITSNGAGNDIVLNSADTIELQDNTNVTGNFVASGTATIQGASATIGTTSQQGSLVLHDGNGQTATISMGSALAANTALALPTGVGASDTFCLQTLANCAAGAAATLQSSYSASTNPEIVLDATRGGLTVRDNATPIAANLLEVQNNGGGTTYFAVTASGVVVTGTATVSGNINTTGGALQTNSTSRIDNTGNLVNIGNLTATGAITIASTGAGNDVVINGADQFIVQDAAAFNAATSFFTDVDFSLAETENVELTNTVTGTNALDLQFNGIVNNTSSGTQRGLLVQNMGGSGVTDALLVLDNADVDTVVTTGLQISSAAGAITTAIDVSDSDIGTALLFGANDIDGTNFDITGATGSFTSAGNGILQGGSITLGTTSQQGSLVLHDGNGQTATISMGSALAANTALALPTGVGASDTFCLLTLGNCASGSGITGSGTTNRMAKFTSGTAIGDSIITDNGTLVSVAGNLSATALVSATLDTGSAVALNIGAASPTATIINLNQSTTLAAGKSLTITGGNTASRPGSPTEGMLYFDTTTKALLVYANGKWQADRTTANKTVAMGSPAGCTGSVPSASANPDGADYVVNSCTSAQTLINTAISALPAAGGTVYLMDGTYIIDGSIVVPSNVTVSGAGAATTIKFKNSINATMNGITNSDAISGNANIVLRDFKIDGNTSNQASGTQHAIQLTRVSPTYTSPGGAITGVEVVNARSNGVDIVEATNFAVSRVAAIANGGYGISLSGSTSNVSITESRITENDTGGFFADSSVTRSNISNNSIRTNSFWSIESAAQSTLISGNTVDCMTVTGTYATVSNNSVGSCGGTFAGILVGGDSMIVADNTITGGYAGVKFTGGVQNARIIDNVIIGTYTNNYAIDVNVSSGTPFRTYLSGNTFDVGQLIHDVGVDTIYDGQITDSGDIALKPQSGVVVGATAATSSLTVQGGYTGSALPTPSAPSVTTQGTAGSTSYTYAVTAYDGVGETTVSSTTNIATGNATLNVSNYNRVSWSRVSGAISYRIYRTASAGTPSSTGLVGTVASSAASMQFNDTGIAATGSAPSGNTTGGMSLAGNLQFAQGQAHTISVAQASSGTGNNLTISAGQSGTGANNGGNLILQAGATGGSGTTGSVIVRANGTNSTSAFQIQNAAGTTTLLSADTANLRLNIDGDLVLAKRADAGGTTADWTNAYASTGTPCSQASVDSIKSSAVFNGSLYIGTGEADKAEVCRYDGGTTWTRVNSAAGTFGSNANTDAVTAMVVYNGYLYIGTGGGAAGTGADANTASLYRYDGGTTWTRVNTTQGQFISTTSINGISSMAVFRGGLYIGTNEATNTEVYRYAGGSSFIDLVAPFGTSGQDQVSSMVSYANQLFIGLGNAAGNAAALYTYGGDASGWQLRNWGVAGSVAGDASGIDDIPAMAVYGNALYFSTTDGVNSARWYRYNNGGSATTSYTALHTSAGTLVSGGTGSIESIVSMTTYNGSLYLGTQESNGAEVYKYDGVTTSKVSQTAAGTIRNGGTASIDGVTTMMSFNDLLFVGTNESNSAQTYTYSAVEGQSRTLRFAASSDNAGSTEQAAFPNEGSIFFAAESSAGLQGSATGSFIFSHGITINAGAYDVAEDYPTRDDSLQAGDLVSIDPNERGFVRKATGAYDPGIVGVYSAKPALHIGQADGTIDGGRAVPVALAGRVPLKVSTENGDIKPGDPLAASSVPGVAMKATATGRIVGMAMESYNGEGEGMIIVFVNPNFYGAAGGLQGAGEVSNLLVHGDATIDGDLTVAGTATVGALVTKELTVSGTARVQDIYVGGSLVLGSSTEDPTAQAAHPITQRFKASKPITAGSVVIVDALPGWVTTTTTAGDTRVVGVAVTSATSAGKVIEVAIGGTAKVTVEGAITTGQLLRADAAEGRASVASNPVWGELVGKVIGTPDDNGKVLLLITLQ